MPDERPATRRVPFGDARLQVARITRRGVGMTLAASAFWLVMAGAGAVSGAGPDELAPWFIAGALLVYPAGYALNRALGGDLTARGSELRGLVYAVMASQLLGWALLGVLLPRDPALVAFALAVLTGVHYPPYGWLYRAPAYHALGVSSVLAALALQASAQARAGLFIAAVMGCACLAAGLVILRQNRCDMVA